jgi:hypothetical protein
MAEGVLSRLAQERAVGAFLDSTAVQLSGLVVEVEPRIGKNAVEWRLDIRSRAELGLRVRQPDR